ncbi:galactose oxidase [Obba rivulosa]|uniref:Galactose oxidase n=1 Tax=Obba rivulosa TaxID=1052685 RepID=A0A8E2DTN1_9APHY|nr:galactose oxidase [Obba rivulosa]
MPPLARWSLLTKASWSARSSHCISTTKSGLIVVYSGELKPRTPVDSVADAKDGVTKGSVHIFDLNASLTNIHPDATEARTWQTLPPTLARVEQDATPQIPEPRVGATTVNDGDSIYMWGGRGGIDMAPLDHIQAGLWRGDLDIPSGVRWGRISAVNEVHAPSPRSYHASAILEGKIYIHAGCPVVGRLGTLHAFDIATRKWQPLASAPEPPRGGTALAATSLPSTGPILVRYGGFNGMELPPDVGIIDIYSVNDDKWYTTKPAEDPAHGYPGARSVHGFVPFRSGKPFAKDAVALLFYGEKDASNLGHAGAGAFWDDAWLLTKDATEGISGGWVWKKVENPSNGPVPEGRGWFPGAVWEDGEGESHIVMQGGLLSSNERSDELWELQID